MRENRRKVEGERDGKKKRRVERRGEETEVIEKKIEKCRETGGEKQRKGTHCE